MSEQKRIYGLDFLRGIASLSVFWFHLTFFHYPTSDGYFYHVLRASGTYGWLGVEIFFVISGFIIPYSLYQAGYKLSAYPTFILKRVVRLDPPYLVSIAVILLLAFGYAFYTGSSHLVEGERLSWTRVLLHLAYLNMFFSYEWLNPNFWTLAIEFQYYLLIGLVFPLIRNQRRSLRIIGLAGFTLPAFFSGHSILWGGTPYSPYIFHFAFLFALGISIFQYRTGLASRKEYALLLIAASIGAFFTVGTLPTVAGLVAVAVINLYNRKSLISTFFGHISYSLYLLHWPLGHLTLSLVGAKLLGATTDFARTLVIIFALGVCFAASYLLYAMVERPAQRWSARIKYRDKSRRESREGDVAPAAELG